MIRSGVMFFESNRRQVYALALLAALSGVASAQIKVDAPPDNPSLDLVVNSPFYLQAEAPTCESQSTTSMAYSVDSSTQDVMFHGAQSIQTVVTGVADGPHTIHVKAWNGSGAVCVQNVSLTVGGGLNVSAPAQSATVTSPFVLKEQATTCGGGATSKMTYSLDSGSDTTANGTSLNTTVSAAVGTHILRAKTWGSSGTYCETDIHLNVAGSSGLTPAAGASSRANFEQTDGNYLGGYGPCSGASGPHLELWQTQPDCNTPGNGNETNDSTTKVSTPVYGNQPQSREFTMRYYNQYGGVRWFDQAIPYKDGSGNVLFPQEPSATHFQYDAYVYLVDNSQVSNIEMDINHSIQNTGQLYILAAQCNLHRQVWQVTATGGWVDTEVPCTTTSQGTSGVWHHFQIQTHHDANGGTKVYYDAVAVDGVAQNITTCHKPSGSVYSSSEPVTSCQNTSSDPGWSDFIGPNFQLDGENVNGGTATAYVNKFIVYYW